MNNRYLLIDGVLRTGAIAELYGRGEDIEIEPLYMGTRWQDLQDIGPILVAAPPNLLADAKSDPEWVRCSSLLASTTTLQNVADHLREFICVRGNADSQSLLRFADPLVTWYWLASYAPSQYPHLLGPITSWEVALSPAKWESSNKLQRETYTSGNHPHAAFERTYLDEPQEHALQEAYERQLKTRLYDWLQTHEPRLLHQREAIGAWLHDRLQSAEQAGVNSERSIAIWTLLSLEQGDDFASAPGSLYSQWRTSRPSVQGLPTEVTLQTFFNEHA